MVFLKVLVFRVRLWFIRSVLKMKLPKTNLLKTNPLKTILLKTKALTQNYLISKILRIGIINLFHMLACK